MDVIAKLRSLSTPAKVALGAVALVVVTGIVVGAWRWGGPGAAAGAGAGLLLTVFGIGAKRPPKDVVDRALELAGDRRARAESDAARAQADAERASRARAQARAVEAERVARERARDLDPEHVCDRHSAGPGARTRES